METAEPIWFPGFMLEPGEQWAEHPSHSRNASLIRAVSPSESSISRTSNERSSSPGIFSIKGNTMISSWNSLIFCRFSSRPSSDFCSTGSRTTGS